MSPKAAAAIVGSVDERLAVEAMARLSSAKLGKILAAMEPAKSVPLAEKLAGEVLSLPIGPHHTAEQIDYVCANIREFFARSAGFQPAVSPA